MLVLIKINSLQGWATDLTQGPLWEGRV